MIVSIDSLCDVVQKAVCRLQPGCPLLISGPLGAGKTTFARSILRFYNPSLVHVPSPSFPLMLPYDIDDMRIWHMDLYRLLHEDEVVALDIPDLIMRHRCIIEWPERMGKYMPDHRIDCTISFLIQGVSDSGEPPSFFRGGDRSYTFSYS